MPIEQDGERRKREAVERLDKVFRAIERLLNDLDQLRTRTQAMEERLKDLEVMAGVREDGV